MEEKEECSGKSDDIVVAAETIEDVCTEMVASGIPAKCSGIKQ